MSRKRQQLIDAAASLFAQHGFNGVGIDLIADRAGVSKKTMYTHFRSKDELILAVLKHLDGLSRNQFMRDVESLADLPQDRLLAVFDVARAWYESGDFYGCIFLKAISEFSDLDTPIGEECREYKGRVRAYLEEQAGAAGYERPADVADGVFLLYEGATGCAQVSGDAGWADKARQAAGTLLAAQPRVTAA